MPRSGGRLRPQPHRVRERLSTKQNVQFTLARMHARVHTARLAWVHAARLCDAGKPFAVDAAVAKMTASDAAMANARDATQIFGGNGFSSTNTRSRGTTATRRSSRSVRARPRCN